MSDDFLSYESGFSVAADHEPEGWEVFDAECRTVCYAPNRAMALLIAELLNNWAASKGE